MHDNPVDVASKVIQLFQVIMQSVQTYLKNVEMFIYNKYPDKLSILINFIINAITICQDRLIFDKRDKAIQQLLRKCSDMKNYLEMNQQSLAKFASIQQNKRMSLHSRSSFAYENTYGSKLSMYDRPAMSSKERKSNLPLKSPYDGVITRNPKSSLSYFTSKQKLPSSRVQSRTLQRVKSPMMKKSSSSSSTTMQRLKGNGSNVSTAMQRLKYSKNDIIKTSSENLIEGNESAAPSRGKEIEIMEMMQNIAKERIQEMLTPFLNELKKSLPIIEQSTRPISPLPRVTSEVEKPTIIPQVEKPIVSMVIEKPRVSLDIEKPQSEKIPTPEKPRNFEKIQNVSRNVQYIYVKSNEEKRKSSEAQSKLQPSTQSKSQCSADLKLQPSTSNTKLLHSKREIASTSSQQKAPEMKIVSSRAKPPIPVKEKLDDNVMSQMKEQALKERLQYVEQMMENPLYVNKAYNEPWKIFAG